MSITIGAKAPGAPAGWLDREATVAKPGFNRWLVPPAALAIHLCIGMAYGFSVFWLPLSQAIGISKPVACPADAGLLDTLFTTACDWKVADLGWMFTLFFVLLGSSAAIWGGWLERAGPRKAGVAAAFCWAGGVGLGLGYISPVSTLIKWFPDRRGMATGMAIMGFGGGAMIGSPLATMLMNFFKTPASVGVWQTFLVLGCVYFVYMLGGAFGYRVPPHGWRPQGWAPAPSSKGMITHGHVHLNDALKTPQFWLIWAVLCLNVSAGIGVIGMASPMLQEIFGGSLIGRPELGFAQLDAGQKATIAGIAAGFAGLLSLFNITGRIGWASVSDKLGRKTTFFVFFLFGITLYASTPTFAHMGNKMLFVGAFCVILSMYGGGFATVPAYLADIFGAQYVGAIHGRLLTAWSFAGIVGPVVVNYVREFNKAAGVPADRLYDVTMYVLASFLLLGLICNALVRPVDSKWLIPEKEAEKFEAAHSIPSGPIGDYGVGEGRFDLKAALAWAAVGIPLAWGVVQTFQKVMKIFY